MRRAEQNVRGEPRPETLREPRAQHRLVRQDFRTEPAIRFFGQRNHGVVPENAHLRATSKRKFPRKIGPGRRPRRRAVRKRAPPPGRNTRLTSSEVRSRAADDGLGIGDRRAAAGLNEPVVQPRGSTSCRTSAVGADSLARAGPLHPGRRVTWRADTRSARQSRRHLLVSCRLLRNRARRGPARGRLQHRRTHRNLHFPHLTPMTHRDFSLSTTAASALAAHGAATALTP